ncbi:diguanylate cyclase (GGDEF)-like protein [Pseudomonas duriflava]|uniref:Diguanylate cyclase (GGDEF)-like protein n=1 Tax=Pseudomonas duriflava TaxID=459528 RepID=A0A562PTS5_9PSED|nr:GGDEF domain-containing phosphodiesterase [Pseudomonas duriflava]TWI47798.1 diguanylate cyclase (GGDEF)-like protein [Pseudomonas duriflava]
MSASHDLHHQIETNLVRSSRVLTFSPTLEARYQKDIDKKRKLHISRSHLAGFLAYNSFLICEWFLLDALFMQALLWHMLAAIPTLISLYWVKQAASPRSRERYAAVPCLAGLFAALVILFMVPPMDRLLGLFSLPLMIVYANNTVALPFRIALPFNAIVVPVVIACTFVMQMAPDKALYISCIATVTAIYSLLSNYWLERSERHAYLLNLKEALRIQALAHSNRTLQTLSDTDPLTGVANRRYFVTAFDEFWTRFQANGKPFALLMLDVDYFKPFNDQYGHPAGDNCLQRVVLGLRDQLRDENLLARYGGEEFAILLPYCTQEQARSIAERLRAAVEELAIPHLARGDEGKVVTVSIGVATCATDAMPSTREALIEAADRALYQAKHNGRNQVMAAQETDSHVIIAHPLHTPVPDIKPADLRQALHEHRLQLYYQSIHRCPSNTPVGCEALLRWHDPVHGVVSPELFIPLAERSGLIIELGDWVLRKACQQACQWSEPLFVAVNVSPLQFADPHLADRIGAILTETGLAPNRLVLELTEGVPLNITQQVRLSFRQLRAMGIHLSLDDYCTGYANVAYLLGLEFDSIKIDRSVLLMNEPDKRKVLLRALLDMSRAFNVKVIAEGIETQEQLDLLNELDCDFAQGFLMARPVPAEHLRHIEHIKMERAACIG